MLFTLIVTMGLLLTLMTGWIFVQRAARRVAEQHPEAGPLRLVGGGCGGQGHGHETPPPPAPHLSVAAAQDCAACSNTACKPGAPTSCAPGELDPLLSP